MGKPRHQKCDGKRDCAVYRYMKKVGDEGLHSPGPVVSHCRLCCVLWCSKYRGKAKCTRRHGVTDGALPGRKP